MLNNPIRITERAATEIKHIMAHKNIPPEYRLRVGLRTGGCSGAASFVLGFDKKNENDVLYQIGDIEVLLEKRHVLYLLDVEIDFEENNEVRGFVFNTEK